MPFVVFHHDDVWFSSDAIHRYGDVPKFERQAQRNFIDLQAERKCVTKLKMHARRNRIDNYLTYTVSQTDYPSCCSVITIEKFRRYSQGKGTCEVLLDQQRLFQAFEVNASQFTKRACLMFVRALASVKTQRYCGEIDFRNAIY